jgi:hypothetical protein
MGPIGYPETSVRNYHSTLRNIPNERRSQHLIRYVHKGESFAAGEVVWWSLYFHCRCMVEGRLFARTASFVSGGVSHYNQRKLPNFRISC